MVWDVSPSLSCSAGGVAHRGSLVNMPRLPCPFSQRFIRIGVISGMRQLLEFGLFHGDPHPGNIFALRDGRIAYVDFGNVAELRWAAGNMERKNNTRA